SYFLPSRAYGLNDMFSWLIVRGPPGLFSPRRLRTVWAIMRLRHTLLASRIEMEPGRYDEARFTYTPPASPSKAEEEASDTLGIYDDKTGPELIQLFMDPAAPQKLSAERIARIDIARHGEVSPGVDEYHIILMMVHAVNDGVSLHRHGNMILALLGGAATPGECPRTDAELARLLEVEWKMRWSHPRVDEAIVPATEDRLPMPRSKFQKSAWTVDNQNVQRRAIVSTCLESLPPGGHVLPRVKSEVAKPVLSHIIFDVHESTAVIAKCKSQGVTLASALFALCNFAWIRTEEHHPEFAASKTLPTMMYTAVSLRSYLTPTSPLSSYMSLALGYCNVVLPSFIPPSVNRRAAFWLRARSAQAQMSSYARSPLLFGRSQIMSTQRGVRAKTFAMQDDEADGTLPRRAQKASQRPPLPPPPGVPSAALMGLSILGELADIFRTAHYPAIELVDAFGHVRMAKGGILFFSKILQARLSMTLGWDSAAFPPGVIEEFWGHFVGGVRELILDPPELASKL
ncbi:hypothetical protein C8R44DRAFT_617828, partial [Mycena epipterygia]